MRSATDTASIRSSREVQYLVCVVVLPVLHEQANDLRPCSFSSQAATDESTPPDIRR
jgi:hypothetical protein